MKIKACFKYENGLECPNGKSCEYNHHCYICKKTTHPTLTCKGATDEWKMKNGFAS